MVQKDFVIKNKMGLHARPAARFVKMANSFKSEIWVEKDDEQANGKSIMALMMLAAAYGAKIRLTVEGKDENEAMTSLEELVEAGFYEAETPDPSSKLSKTGTTV